MDPAGNFTKFNKPYALNIICAATHSPNKEERLGAYKNILLSRLFFMVWYNLTILNNFLLFFYIFPNFFNFRVIHKIIYISFFIK